MERDVSKRILLTVAYDGTAYSGWQIQPQGKTVEGTLNDALSQLLGQETQVIGASRTDAGVHALGNRAVFDTVSMIPAEKFSYALNRYLPQDIRITASKQVPEDFHPRKVNCEKTYVYRIFNAPFPDPIRRLYSHFTYVPLNVEKMKEAAQHFVGTMDFAAVSTFKPEVESTVRTIMQITVEAQAETTGPAEKKHAGMITITVRGNGFLYHMVRIIAGTLIDVGCGRLEPAQIPLILETKDREKAGQTAPACGLTLQEIVFIPEPEIESD
ncbi:MAG: tRNA pseudouridine(38-40) synthase TruA [Lachnospiraceae bacterium]|nr:tRNA pseudouridine(38-40) synthase TruA [Lachnospiraceae bacterium]